jgi:hypothetical protein
MSVQTKEEKKALFLQLQAELKQDAQSDYDSASQSFIARKEAIADLEKEAIKEVRETFKSMRETDEKLNEYREDMESAKAANNAIITKGTSAKKHWREKYNLFTRSDTLVWTVSGKTYVEVDLSDLPTKKNGKDKSLERTKADYVVSAYIANGLVSGQDTIQDEMIGKYASRLSHLISEQDI